MRSFTSSRPAWSASRISRASVGSRRSSDVLPHGTAKQPLEVAADHRRLGRAARPCARAGRARARPARGPPRAGRSPRSSVRYSSITEPSSSPSSLRIDSICLRRKYSRCCFCAPDSTSSWMRRRTCSSASRSRWKRIASSSRSTTSSVSSSSTRCSKRQVGRVGAGVGERARLGDRAQELADASGSASPQLEDLLDDRAVLGLELARLDGRRRLVGPLLDLDEQPAVARGLGGAEQRARAGR